MSEPPDKFMCDELVSIDAMINDSSIAHLLSKLGRSVKRVVIAVESARLGLAMIFNRSHSYGNKTYLYRCALCSSICNVMVISAAPSG